MTYRRRRKSSPFSCQKTQSQRTAALTLVNTMTILLDIDDTRPFIDSSSQISNFLGTVTADSTYVHLFLAIGITVWLIAFILCPGCCCCIPALIYSRFCKTCEEDALPSATTSSSNTAELHQLLNSDSPSIKMNNFNSSPPSQLCPNVCVSSPISGPGSVDLSKPNSAPSVAQQSSHSRRCSPVSSPCCLRLRSCLFPCALLLSVICAPIFAFFVSAFSLAPWGAMGLVPFIMWSIASCMWIMHSEQVPLRDLFFTLRSSTIVNRVRITAFVLFLAFTSWFTAFAVADLCIALHPVHVSTRLTRRWSGPSCAAGAPCLVYLTGAADFSSELIVNFHINSPESIIKSAAVRVWLFNSNPSAYRLFVASCFRVEFIIDESRHVCWADLRGLVPSSLHSFSVEYQSSDSSASLVSDIHHFRTAPSSNSSFTLDPEYSFIVGGDYESSSAKLQLGPQLSRAASSRFSHSNKSASLRFGLITGDVCYANAMHTCYRRWDGWIREWNANMHVTEIVNSTEGFVEIQLLVPILAAIGNHEAGGMFGQSPDLIPFYSRYLPQQLGLQPVDPAHRPMYHAHWLGNHSVLLVLDSGITSGNDVDDPSNEQTRFIHSTLQAAVDNCVCNRFVAYHYALYPSKQNPWEVEFVKKIRGSWGTLFDMYNVTFAFEHHYHLFKLTPQIRNGRAVCSSIKNRTREGVTYLGDGNWGIVDNFNNVKPDAWYIEQASPAQHVYIVTARTGSVSVVAIAPDGGTFLEIERITSIKSSTGSGCPCA